MLVRRGRVAGDPEVEKRISLKGVFEWYRDWTAGAPIFMPSYSLHYDRSRRPVMRGGIVSSDPGSDYLTDGQEPARRVLYQAQSAEGASGAPVFALMDTEAVLLGVNAGQLLLPPSNVPSGFSYCFKAECIRECIEELRRQDASAATG
jgi:hypothetical protein